jgi:UDP-3-O-[3-hydroxymyristoyl] glucosamine N-acyltransferase
MRIRDGFTLSGAPALLPLLIDAPGLPSRRFFSLAEPGREDPDSLVVVATGTRLDVLANLRAALVLAEDGVTGLPDSLPVLRVRDARRALAALLNALGGRAEFELPEPAENAGNNVHPTAVVEGVLGGEVTVEAGAFVGANVFVGRGSRLEANCVVRGPCVIGPRAVVQSGAVIGCAGFGFFASPTGAEAMPHLAGARIGADCFIGANAVVAAGVLHPTELGDGCKLDSHVQVAHNVTLGARAMLASQSGVAGSTVIGDDFRMGGAASVAGHLRIGNNVSVAAKSGVTKDVADGMTVAGFPARPIGEWRRGQAALARLGNQKSEI